MNRPILTFILFAFLFTACSLFDDDGPKDPRDYTWTIDTLKHPDPTTLQLMMNEMWASSSDDIYIVGHSSSGFGTMWHFNGDDWSPVPIIKKNGGHIENKNHKIYDIFGFSKNDIWAVGSQVGKKRKRDAFVIHYDGWKWREITPPDTSELLSVGGDNNGEIWVGPWGGGVIKYAGGKWVNSKINIPGKHGNSSYVSSFTYQPDFPSYMLYINHEINPRYFTSFELYKHNGAAWNFITHDVMRPWMSENGIIYYGGKDLTKIENGNIFKVWEAPTDYGIVRIHGKEDNFIVCAMNNSIYGSGNIVFYNGKKWIELLENDLEGVYLADIWTDGKTVVAIGNYNSNTFVLRGE